MSPAPEVPRGPRWAARLAELSRRLAATGSSRDPRVLEELWLLLTAGFAAFLRHHRQRLPPLPEEDYEDLITQKCLEILGRLDDSTWEPDPAAPETVAAYVSSCARNALVDHLRRDERNRRILDEQEEPRLRDRLADLHPKAEDPSLELERRSFADALQACVARLKPRERTIWIFRVFHEMRSRTIARHPEVRLQPGHVDVILHDCRRKVTACMEAKGLRAADMPPGCYATLWQAFRLHFREEVDGHEA